MQKWFLPAGVAGTVRGMKKLVLLLGVVCLFAMAGVIAADSPMKKHKLLHVVSIKFKADATPAQIKGVETAFRALKTKIPQIATLEWGTNNSPEKMNKGFTHCFVLSFESEADRAVYLPHPEHKKFGAVLGPVMDDVMVVDFWAQD
jgi:hypothetical protein